MKTGWKDTIYYKPLKLKTGDQIPRANSANVLLLELEQEPFNRDSSDCKKLSEFTQ